MATRVRTNRPLRFRNALRLKMAEYWLALGQTEDAWRELSRLPLYTRTHPEVQRVRRQFLSLPGPEMGADFPGLANTRPKKRKLVWRPA